MGGSLKRLKTAETLLWQGQIQEAKALFHNCRGKQAKFTCYLSVSAKSGCSHFI